MQAKVCPIILRVSPHSPQLQLQILLFRHPAEDIQFVKGTVENLEDLLSASVRELWEESGLKIDKAQFNFFKQFTFQSDQQEWFVYWSEIKEMREDWSWQTLDDYGHQFNFFLCPLEDFALSSEQWKMNDRFRIVIDQLIQYFNLCIEG